MKQVIGGMVVDVPDGSAPIPYSGAGAQTPELTVLRRNLATSAAGWAAADAALDARLDILEAATGQIGVDASLPASGRFDGDTYWATDTNRLRLWDGAGWIIMHEPWQTTFTSTITQSSTVSATKTYDRFQRRGGNCRYRWSYACTSSGDIDNALLMTVPKDIANLAALELGSALIFVASARANVYPERNAATKMGFGANGATANLWGLSPSARVVSGDALRGDIDYEMADPYA